MLRYIFLALLNLIVLTSSGCGALKQATGEYVTDAVRQKIVADVDDLLDKRGLSVTEIKHATDQNNDGHIDRTELLSTVKGATRDYVLLEARNYVEQKMAENRAQAVSQGDLQSTASNFWNWILGLIAAYLTKQIYSAKKDGKRDERIAILEKIANKDLDGDGKIGGVEPEDSVIV